MRNTAAMNRAGLVLPQLEARTPKKKQRPEAALQATIIKAIERTYGPTVLVERTNAGMAHTSAGNMINIGKAGTSDLKVCLRGRFIALEVKTATGRLTDKQARYLEQVRAAGGIGEVVRSVDEALAILEQL
jgi:hypothetical protein